MSDTDLPAEIKNFVYQYIDSAETVAVLFFLRSIPSEWKTPEQIGRELRSNPASVRLRLLSLRSRGLIVQRVATAEEFQYRPQTSDLDRLVEKFAEIYRVKPHKIFELIFSSNRQAQQFANAFILGKGPDKKGEGDG